MLERRLSALPLALLLLSTPLLAKNRVDLEYNVRFLPESDQAEVRITLDEGEEVRSLTFNLGKKGYYSDFQTDGQWQQSAPHSGVWQPKSGKSSLTYKVKVSHEREDGRFDARVIDAAIVLVFELLQAAQAAAVAQRLPLGLVELIEGLALPEGFHFGGHGLLPHHHAGKGPAQT